MFALLSYALLPVFLRAHMIGHFSYFLLIYAMLELFDNLNLTLLLNIVFKYKLTKCSLESCTSQWEMNLIITSRFPKKRWNSEYGDMTYCSWFRIQSNYSTSLPLYRSVYEYMTYCSSVHGSGYSQVLALDDHSVQRYGACAISASLEVQNHICITVLFLFT